PPIGQCAQLARDTILEWCGVIGDDIEACRAQQSPYRRDETRHRMLAQIPGDEADAQAPLRIARQMLMASRARGYAREMLAEASVRGEHFFRRTVVAMRQREQPRAPRRGVV